MGSGDMFQAFGALETFGALRRLAFGPMGG
jgi:hypothetical protein